MTFRNVAGKHNVVTAILKEESRTMQVEADYHEKRNNKTR